MATPRLVKSAHSPHPANLYRYRTAALVGPWRATRVQAMLDALHAGQVRRDECDLHELRWMVEGRIEERSSDRPAAARTQRVAPPRGA